MLALLNSIIKIFILNALNHDYLNIKIYPIDTSFIVIIYDRITYSIIVTIF